MYKECTQRSVAVDLANINDWQRQWRRCMRKWTELQRLSVCACSACLPLQSDHWPRNRHGHNHDHKHRPLVTGPMRMNYSLNSSPFCSSHPCRTRLRLWLAICITNDTTDWHQSINNSINNYGFPEKLWHLPTGLNQCCKREGKEKTLLLLLSAHHCPSNGLAAMACLCGVNISQRLIRPILWIAH